MSDVAHPTVGEDSASTPPPQSSPQPLATPTKSTHAAHDNQGQLPLEYSWDLYHIDPRTMDQQMKDGVWEPLFISTFSTVRDFWCLFNNIATPTFLPAATMLYLFKHGVPPKWESPENNQGGELTVIFDITRNDEDGCDAFDDAWINTLLALIGEYFTDSDQIKGISCSIKAKWIKIAIWVGDAKNTTALGRIKQDWIKLNPIWKVDDVSFRPFTK